MPSYSPNVPQATDDPSLSQSQMLQNFQVLATDFAINHGPYSGVNEGKHTVITMPVQSPAHTFLSTEIGLQNLDAAPSNQPDIWLTRGNAGQSFPMTGFANGAVSGNNATAWTYLPSGFLIIGGKLTTSAGTVSVTFNTSASGGLDGFPGFTTFVCYILATPINAGASVQTIKVTSFNTTSATFALVNGAVDETFFWTALGL